MSKQTFFFHITFLLLLGVVWGCGQKENDSTEPTPETPKPGTPTVSLRGADVSFLPELRKSGLVLYNRLNQAEDLLLTLKRAGVNTIRLRIWKNPTEPVSDLETVKALAQECKNLGFKILLTIHYSDTWADPGNQTKPLQWQSSSTQALHDSVRAYTQTIITQIQPEYVQIGNEINSGLLWPDGNINQLSTFKSLLKTAIEAVRETNSTTRIIIHYAGHEGSEAFYANLTELDYDIIGLSYYPIWHGKDLNLLETTLARLATQYGKQTLLAETSYPFTLGWNDWTNNIIGGNDQLIPDFKATPEGQQQYMKALKKMILNQPKCIGFCYWGGEWMSYYGNQATNGSTWENQAFWDFNNKALPILDQY